MQMTASRQEKFNAWLRAKNVTLPSTCAACGSGSRSFDEGGGSGGGELALVVCPSCGYVMMAFDARRLDLVRP